MDLDEAAPASGEVRDLLVFEIGSVLYGVDAARVDAVINWRDPVPLPAAGPTVLGVVQDRGRVIAVMQPASGAAPRGAFARIIVCRTARGLVGLPAATTRTVGPMTLSGEVRPGSRVESAELGTLVLVELDGLVADAADKTEGAGT